MSYVMYSLRLNGWLSKHGNYTSDRNNAEVLPRDQALARCRRHKDDRGLSLIPVALEDLDAI